MKQNLSFLCMFLLLITSFFTCFANSAEISNELFEAFNAEKLMPEKQALENSQSFDFPYNIIIELNKDKISENHNSILITIKQKECIKIFPILSQFIKNIKKQNFPIPIIILCSANDESLLKNPTYDNAGIKTFLNANSQYENLFGIVLDVKNFSEKNLSMITPLTTGGKKNVTPYQILTKITEKFNSLYLPYFIEMPYFSLYRLDAVNVNSQLSFLLENDIPSFALGLKNHIQTENVFTLIKNYIQDFEIEKHDITLDKQYSVINFFNKTIILTEKIQIYIFVIISGFFLLFIAMFSFFNKTNFLYKSTLLQTWFLPFILFALNILCFYLSKKICTSLIYNWQNFPITSFVFFILVSLSLFYTFANIQYIFTFPSTTYVYEFLHTIVAMLNFFIFSFIDFSLMPLFAVEYIIIYSSRSIKKTLPLVFTFFIMLFPFVPFGISLILNCNRDAITNLIDAKFSINAFLSILIISFQFIFIRIRVRRNTFGRHYTRTFKSVLKLIIIPFSIFIILLFSIFIFNAKTKDKTTNDFKTQIIKTDTQSLNIKIEKNNISSLTEYICTFNTNTNKVVIRYNIEINSNDILPIYESNFPYDIFSKPNVAIFNLDETPPNPLTLKFRTETKNICSLQVKAFLKNSNNVIFEEYYLVNLNQEFKK